MNDPCLTCPLPDCDEADPRCQLRKTPQQTAHHRAIASDETVLRARELSAAGCTYKQIGQELGVNWRTVSDWVKNKTRLGATRQCSRPDSVVRKARELHAAGWNVPQIARALHVPTPTVWNWCSLRSRPAA